MAGDPLEVFISYSRKDEGLKDELARHLKILRREGKINTWQDRDIEAGTEWAAEIKAQLEKAQIILLLVTSNFLASDYCYETEMQRAVQRHHAGTARVIPIILKPCGWKYSDFKGLQALPKDGKPVTSWRDREEALFDIEIGIRQVVESIHAEQRDREQEAARQQVIQQQQQTEAARRERERQAEQKRQKEQAAAEQLRRQRGAEALLRQQQLEQLETARREQKQEQSTIDQWHQTQGEVETAQQAKLPNLQKNSFQIATITGIQPSRFWGLVGKQANISRQPGEVTQFDEVLDDGLTLAMVKIPGGQFWMGSPDDEEERQFDEGPQHSVTIQSFWMGKYVVTQAQWAQVAAYPKVRTDLEPFPAYFKGPSRPVERVSWEQAVEFCQRLSQKTGRTYRLPSEAQWEYACRAGMNTPFHFGPTITTDLANYRGTDWEYGGATYLGSYGDGPYGVFREQTTEVGSFSPNAFGLYDMHGNVWEWCQDVWHSDYEGAPTDDFAWTEGGDQERRVVRGGSWLSVPEICRSATRDGNAPDGRGNDIGFRVVCGVA